MEALKQSLWDQNPEGSKRPYASALCLARNMVRMAPLDLSHLPGNAGCVWTCLTHQPLKRNDLLENESCKEPEVVRDLSWSSPISDPRTSP